MKRITIFTYIILVLIFIFAFSLCISAYEDNYNDAEADLSISSCILIALGIGLVAGIITVLILINQLKSVKSAKNASVYVESGSFALTEKRDVYLYSTVTKIPKPKNNSSKSR